MNRYWRHTPVSRLCEGDVLAHPVYDANGRLLLRAGSSIDDRTIESLRKFATRAVYVLRTDVPSNEPPFHFQEFCDPYPRQRSQSLACGGVSGLSIPTRGLPSSAWLCHRCGCVYFGAAPTGPLAARTVRELSAAALELGIEPRERVVLPESLDNLLRTATQVPATERRRHVRVEISIPVVVAAVDESFRFAGNTMELESRDISQGGLSLKHRKPILTPYLYASIAREGSNPLEMITKVVRSLRVCGAFDVGAQWFSRIVAPPPFRNVSRIHDSQERALLEAAG